MARTHERCTAVESGGGDNGSSFLLNVQFWGALLEGIGPWGKDGVGRCRTKGGAGDAAWLLTHTLGSCSTAIHSGVTGVYVDA